MSPLILYGAIGCHLCDEAQRVIYRALGVPLAMIDITDDPELLEHYSLRIPVLRLAATGAEIDWPFGPTEVQQLYQGSAPSAVP